MSDTSKGLFEAGVANFLGSCIFPAIVAGLAADGYNTSVETLSRYTNTPNIRPIPSMTATTTATAKKKTTTAPAPMAAPVITSGGEEITHQGTPFVLGKTCAYRFKRGELIKGKYCGKTTQNGSKFCNIKNHKASEKDSPVNPGVAPTPDFVVQEDQNNGSLEVEEYDTSLNLFREKVHNFIVTPHESEEGVVIVLGRLKTDGGKDVIVDLTEHEKIIANKIGLHFPVNEIAAVPEVVVPVIQPIPVQTVQPIQVTPVIPIIPQKQTIPIIPSIPTIPTL